MAKIDKVTMEVELNLDTKEIKALIDDFKEMLKRKDAKIDSIELRLKELERKINL